MSIGVGIFLIAVGAILRFGITTVSTNGFNVHTIGDILMIIGALGVVLWLIVWAPWGTRARSRRTVVSRRRSLLGRLSALPSGAAFASVVSCQLPGAA